MSVFACSFLCVCTCALFVCSLGKMSVRVFACVFACACYLNCLLARVCVLDRLSVWLSACVLMRVCLFVCVRAFNGVRFVMCVVVSSFVRVPI